MNCWFWRHYLLGRGAGQAAAAMLGLWGWVGGAGAMLAGAADSAGAPGPEAHRFSVYFDASSPTLYSEERVTEAIGWCQSNGVSKVYIEVFHSDEKLTKDVVARTRDRFRGAGLEAAAAIKTDKVSSDPNDAHCFSEPEAQKRLFEAFEFTAGLFDEIIIDDFLFSDCQCTNCLAPLDSRLFKVGAGLFSFGGGSLPQLRGDMMLRVSHALIHAPATNANPNVRLTVKFPKWYDKYQLRGYDVARQTGMFHQIWAGTETRNFSDCVPWIGGTPPYGAYFVMRWLSRIGGEKLGGGWFDWIHCDAPTFVEQARQTILGGARETILFHYGGLNIASDTNGCDGVVYHPSQNMPALREAMPELRRVAAEVRGHRHAGIATYKPVNSGPEATNEMELFSFVGMLGLPLEPFHVFPTNAPAAFFSTHALKDEVFPTNLEQYIQSGKPVLITESLRTRLAAMKSITASNVAVLAIDPAATNAASLLKLSRTQLDALRAPLLRTHGVSFSAPAGVALYLFKPNGHVIENFNSTNVAVQLNGKELKIAARGWLTDFPPKPAGHRAELKD